MSSLYRLVPVVTLLAANSCTGPPDDIRQNPAWMIGKWGWVSPSEQIRLAGDCSPEVEFYRRDGYVVDFAKDRLDNAPTCPEGQQPDYDRSSGETVYTYSGVIY